MISRIVIALIFVASGSVVSSAEGKRLKVFVLVGQSNMQGHAQVRTLEHVGMDPKTAALLDIVTDESGDPKPIDDVWITYLSAGGVKQGQLTTGFGASDEKIGPELLFGATMSQQVDEPVLIIKAAWGGKSLNTDFRPPSAGAYEFSSQQKEQFEKQNKDLAAIRKAKDEAKGHYYRLMLQHVRDSLANLEELHPQYDQAAGHELAGFVWFQGWNDMVDRGTYPDRGEPGGYDQYSEVMTQFIRDVRKDLSAPDLPFVIGVLGVGGPVRDYLPAQRRYSDVHQNFRSAMAAPASDERLGNRVGAVLTENYWDPELTRLRAKENEVRQAVNREVKEGTLKKQQSRPELEKRLAEVLTEKELTSLRVGVSNAEYHYLGSAKIMAQIGKAFAEEMIRLRGE